MAFTGNYACNVFKTGLPSGTYNFNTGTTHVFKLALYTNAATLNADTTGYTATGEVSGTGYSAGGATLTITTTPTTGGSGTTAFFSFADVTWLASTITARGALLYKFDGATNPAVLVLDFGADKISSASPFVVVWPPATNSTAIVRIGSGT